VNQPEPLRSARSRAFYADFLALAARSADLLDAMHQAMAPDCRVYAQNGDVVTPAASRQHTTFGRIAFPDLVAEVEDVLFPDDRLVVQVRMSGTVSPLVPSRLSGPTFTSTCAIVGRVDERLRLSEVWSYINPGFPLSFPPHGLHHEPPPEDAAGPAEARAMYETWVRRAEGGQDFIGAVASTFAPGGVVHPGNGDTGGLEALHALFQVVTAGLPDLSLHIDDVMISQGRAVVQFAMSGTHQGPLGIYAPTGKVLPSRGMLVARPDAQARAAELWVYLAPAYALTLAPAAGLASKSGGR